ncbi:putative metalloprotease CJM1_0395 family protein [Sulfurivermis fontis]|uniref:putative metalloprotease CJM1_0395 family protein n=1 Tax=Sulfurivermis fontis TaxID=1972068 RepID=UPI000FD7890F|nr:putative metalloprotease CJM1_0395 family protein [Sulfurivermis fontis]
MEISAASRIAALPPQAAERRAAADNAAPEDSTQAEQGTAAQRAVPAQAPEEQRMLQQLQARDREVRAHELAHVAAGAGLVRSGAAYSYQRGPDGRFYAVGGEVSIDTAAVPGDPAATERKAEQIMRAALAPAEPSGQDRAVAAQAARMAAEARLQQALEAGSSNTPGDNSRTPQLDLYA